MRTILIFGTLISLIAFGCGKKTYDVTVSGTLRDIGNNELIPDAWVYVQDGMGTSGDFYVYETHVESIDSTLTDENGQFELNKEYINGSLFIFYIKEGYNMLGTKEALSTSNSKNLELWMNSESYINCVFTSAFQINDSHQLKVGYWSYLPEYEVYSMRGVEYSFSGVATFKDSIKIFKANRNIILDMDYTNEQGEWVNEKDTIFVSAHEAYTDTVWYGDN